MIVPHPPQSWELPPGPHHPTPAHALAQDNIDDEVLIAGTFLPNASGSGELRSLGGLQQRQLLKGRHAYLGERLILALTALHLYVVPPMVGLPLVGPRMRSHIASFDRSRILAEPSTCAVRDAGPALLLSDRRLDVEIAEIRTRPQDPGAVLVLEQLLSDSRRMDHH